MLNIALAAVLFVVVRESQSPWLAFIIVLLSKWRALAVRPRFWFANLVANTVDIIVGVSTVLLLYTADDHLWLQLIFALLYACWLLLVKPRSKRSYVAFQAGVAVFLGITALSIVSYSWDSIFFVGGMWIIGYAAARHVLGSYDEPYVAIYSLIAGVIFAELGWIGYHWLMAYPLPGFGGILFSQLALFTTLFCLIAEHAYASYYKHGSIRGADVALPIILTGAVMITSYVFALLFGAGSL